MSTSANSDTYYYYNSACNSSNYIPKGSLFSLFLMAEPPKKEKSKTSKWIEKQIRRRGRR